MSVCEPASSPDSEPDSLAAWRDCLAARLRFPAWATVTRAADLLPVGERLKLLSIEAEVDEEHGVLAYGRYHATSFVYPLSDLAIEGDGAEVSNALIKGYCAWWAVR